ncbi:conserved hypothetical protein [Ricinus communis]|uniref:RNase H type-1 domain-containing protein n=1 Tax=Ricinus communis TaxID=3988 RepID=B9R7J1_RICCO|nr:conserved hypothetical protein [Ricinus communis]
MNVDAAMFANSNKVGVGRVLRVHEGNFLSAFVNSFPGNVVVLIAEALALREALQWLVEQRYNHVILESDSLLVVQAFHCQDIDLSVFGFDYR